MQAIWSRALQLKSPCSCSLCTSPGSVLSRRGNIRPIRRRQFGDYFTACYSSILATAVCFDAKRKQDRRDRLDQAIDQVQWEVDTLNEDQRKRLEAIGYGGQEDLEQLLRRKCPPRDLHKETVDFYGPESHQKVKASTLSDQPVRFREAPPVHKALIPFEDEHRAFALGRRNVGHNISWENVANTIEEQEEISTESTQKPRSDSRMRTETRAVDSEPSVRNQSETISFDNATQSHSLPQGKQEFRILNYPKLSWEHLNNAHSVPEPAVSESIDENSVDAVQEGNRHNEARHASSASLLSKTEVYKLLLSSSSHHQGRCSEDVWNSQETPFLPDRNRMQREAAIARLAYTLIMSYLTSPEVGQGHWPGTIRLDVPGRRCFHISNGNRAELTQKIEDLGHRLRVLAGLRRNLPALLSLEDLSYPRYQAFGEQDRDAEANYIAVQNDALLEIFVQSSSPNELFSKLCSTLLSQSFAPNIHTYNLLIIRLCHAQYFAAAEYVIGALNASSINHNEVTYAAVLNCYSYSAQSSSFRAYLNRMDGIAGCGVRTTLDEGKVSNSLQPELYMQQARDIHSASMSTNVEDATMYKEKAMRNSDVCEAIILGWLDIGNLDKAMKEYSSMLASGLPTRKKILEAFLKYSVKTANWEVGRSVWEQIKSSSRPVSVMTYYWMLQLCALCEQPEQFESILQDGLHHDILKARLLFGDFMLTDKKRKQLRTRAFAIWRLEQRVWIPGLTIAPCLEALEEQPQLPNLYLMVLVKFLDLVNSKNAEVGRCASNWGWAVVASRELGDLQKKGLLRDKRMSSRAVWSSTKLKAEQSSSQRTGRGAAVMLSSEPPQTQLLPKVPSIQPSCYRQKDDLLTVDLTKALDSKTADLLQSYLSRFRIEQDSSGLDKPEASDHSEPTAGKLLDISTKKPQYPSACRTTSSTTDSYVRRVTSTTYLHIRRVTSTTTDLYIRKLEESPP